jgi:hypothetical protein
MSNFDLLGRQTVNSSNVLVPTGKMGELFGVGTFGKALEDLLIGSRGLEAKIWTEHEISELNNSIDESMLIDPSLWNAGIAKWKP